jgi:glucose-1-phosphate adenylyltransferase
MDHVGSGKDWDLARKDGGLIILPPFGDTESNSLYNTRLEALKGITSFLFRADEEYVVMTDCDSVCRINYNEVLEYHIRNQADITLIYKKGAPISGSIDYGTTFDVNESGRIVGLNYKTPLDVKDANVFINVFVMKKSLLQNIVMDSISHNKKSFTNDIIAENLKSMKIMGFEHKGFYAGISSLQAYFDSNMAMLQQDIRNEVFGDRSVFTKIRDSAPTKYGNSALVKNSMIALGCEIYGSVENSVLGSNVIIEEGAVVKDAVIFANTVIKAGATVSYTIIDENVTVGKNAVVGVEKDPKAEIVVLGRGLTVADGVTVSEGQKHEKDILA